MKGNIFDIFCDFQIKNIYRSNFIISLNLEKQNIQFLENTRNYVSFK